MAEDGRDRAPDLRGAEGGHPEADPGPGAGRAEAACLLQLWEAEPIKFMTSDVSETSGVNKIFANLLSIGEKSSSFRLYILFIVVSVFFQGDG